MIFDPEDILAEQRAARDRFGAGDRSRGVRLWIADAVAEEVLMIAEDVNASVS